MKFNKIKRRVLHLGQGNPEHEYRLKNVWIESCPAKKDLSVLLDEKPNTSLQCVFAIQIVNHTLGFIERNVPSRLREVILLLYSTLMRSHLEYCVQLWGAQHKKDMDLLVWAWGRATKIRGLAHL